MRKHYHHQSQQQQSLWSLRTLWARTISWVGHSLGVCAFHHDHSLTHCLYARLSCYVVLSFDLTDCCAAGCKVPCGKSDAAAMLSMEGERGWGECQCDFFFFSPFFLGHHFYFRAQLVGGFTLSDLLDKRWSQEVSSLLPPGTCLQFIA